jgi:DNA polymerase-3 subunit alpha
MVKYLILDTETSGLPDCKGLRFSEFPSFDILEKYDGSRVVQISYIVCDNNMEPVRDSDIIIDTEVSIGNHQFHGITNEIAKAKGILFTEFAKIFMETLTECDVIIAHNIKFDINVLKSELYRIGRYDIIKYMNTKRYVCTMNYCRQLVGIPSKNGFGMKNPSLKELYHFATGKVMENHHTCSYDTSNLLEIVKVLYSKGDFNVYYD